MKTNIISAIRLTLVCLVFFSGIYTLLVYALAQFSPDHGAGEKIHAGGRTYYQDIGQAFTDDRYFNSRPSAVNYNAAGAGGSNKGPSNHEYLALVQSRIDSFRIHNPTIDVADIPADLVTASGSGLDPNISVEAATVQIPRIAKLRALDEKDIALLVAKYTEKPLLSALGPSKINVLKLNIALDQMK